MENTSDAEMYPSPIVQARLKILEMVEQGKISAAEAADMLVAVGAGYSVNAEEQEDEQQSEWTSPAMAGGYTETPQPRTTAASPQVEWEADAISQPSPEQEVSSTPASTPPGFAQERSTLRSQSEQPHQSAPAGPGRTSSPSGNTSNFSSGEAAKIKKWRSWWTIPLAIGVGVAAFSGWLMYVGFQREWSGFWVGCLWLPLLIGVTLTTLGWLSRTAIWMHVRVNTGQDEWPRRIAISMPIPLRLTAWALKAFGHFIPSEVPLRKLSHPDIDEIVQALSESLQPDDPLYIEVEEGEGPSPQKVQVFIG